LNIWTQTLKRTRSVTSSQCKTLRRMCVRPLSYLRVFDTRVFGTHSGPPHILLGQTKSFHFSYHTIPACLPWTSPWFSSFHFVRCSTFNPFSIILMFYLSKPFQSAFLNHQTDWFQSQQSEICVFLLSFKVKPYIHLIMLILLLSHSFIHENYIK